MISRRGLFKVEILHTDIHPNISSRGLFKVERLHTDIHLKISIIGPLLNTNKEWQTYNDIQNSPSFYPCLCSFMLKVIVFRHTRHNSLVNIVWEHETADIQYVFNLAGWLRHSLSYDNTNCIGKNVIIIIEKRSPRFTLVPLLRHA